jgi:hypothetical protein
MPLSPRYPSLTPTSLALVAALARGQRRSLLEDSRHFVERLSPGLRIEGPKPSLPPRGAVLVANHYRSPAFRAWWIGLALTAALGEEIHWVMTAAWTFRDPIRARTITPLTRALFGKLARTYGLTLMPPMPPSTHEVAARARAVREVLHYVTQVRRPLIGLVPEGGDSPAGDLSLPPPGIGRFLSLLASHGLVIFPAGVFEDGGTLCVRFGMPFTPHQAGEGRPEARDRTTAHAMMRSIADCLPERLRGPYRTGEATDERR